MKLYNALLLTVVMAFIVLSIPSVDAFGNELSYFGVNVRNSSNQLWNGQYTIGTIAYPSSSSGTVLFSTTSTVNITAGNFVVTFNNTNVDKNQTFWIATNISGTVYPRFQYTAAAQSVYADNASNAASGSSYNPAGIYANVSALQTFRDAVYVNVTALQGGAGTGNVSGGGISGNIPLWNGTTSINRSGIYQNGTTIVIGSPDVDTGAGGQQILEISRNGPRAQFTINDNVGANGSVLHFRSGTNDFYIRSNSTQTGLFVENDSAEFPYNITQWGSVSQAGPIYINGNIVLTNASSIDFSQLTGYNTALVNTSLINATNSLSTGYCLTAAGSADQFTWASCGSGGGGNITGSSNSSGVIPMFSSTTSITNSSITVSTLGDVYFRRNIRLQDYGSDASILFNDSNGGGLRWIRASNATRLDCLYNGTCDIYGKNIEYNGAVDIVQSLYSDTANRSMSFLNTGSQELWLNFDDKVGVNATISATSQTLSVIGGTNLSSTLYLDGYKPCTGTLGVNSLGAVVCQTNGSGSSFDPSGLYTNVSALQTLTTYTSANTSIIHPSWVTFMDQEFMAVTGTQSFGWIGAAAIASGTGTAIVNGEIDHPGIVSMSDSATAGGGYLYSTAANAILLNQSEGFTVVLQAPGGKAGETDISAGFTDASAGILTNVDGCFFAYNLTQANVNTIMGRCRSNSVETNTTTNYTATNNTWYVMKGYLNASGTGFNFSLYNGTGVLLWSGNVSTNIPTNSVNLFRQTGVGVVAVQNTTDAGTVIANVDYIAYFTNRTLSRY